MNILNINSKRGLAGLVAIATFFMYALPLPVLASEISNITPVTQGGHNVYNIEAAKTSGSTGFRHYDKFNLTQGDIANLKFNNYTKFVNLVNNKISINGIVNTMKGNNFYNGHAIFVSPNGMVVGSSGVLNVGALSVLTPSQSKFNTFKSNYDSDSLDDYIYGAEKYKELVNDSHGVIDINGKILSKGDVELYADNINIKGSSESRAGIISGVQNQNVLTEEQAAQTLFNNLVSNNITNTTNFALEDGKIKIVASKKSGFADAGGDVKTNIDIQKADIGANEIDISATSEVDRQEGIDLAQAKVSVEDSNITGDTVSIIAKATQHKDIDSINIIDDGQWIVDAIIDIFSSETPSIGALWGVAGKAEADVTIKNSIITAINSKTPNDNNSALSVLIHAEASSETAENANFLTPSIIHFFQEDDAHLDEYFSSDIYNGFEGARSSATVTIDNSTISAKGEYSGDIEISTEATSSLDANNRLLGFIIPIGMFALGTGTTSKAIVKNNSVLSAQNGDVDVTAISTNNNAIEINNHGLYAIKLEDAYIGMILNNTVKTDTEAAIISSSVDADNLSVFATNLTDSSADVVMQAVAGTKDEGTGEEVHGNSAVSVVAVLNRSKNEVSAYINDSKDINLESDVLVLAQSLNITSCLPDATINDRATQLPTTFDARIRNFLRDAHFKYFNVNIFNAIKGRTKVAATQAATLEVGGVLDWNETNNTTTAEIINSKIISQDGDVKVNANTVDLHTNSATTDIYGEGTDVHGQGVYGLALTVIYSIQNNTTTADIDDSTVEANNIDVNATTELPMNQGQLTFGLILPFKICGVGEILFGGNFASEANGKWDISPVYPQAEDGAPVFEVTGLATQNIRDIYSDLKPIVRFQGFFNNIAQSSVAGENAAVSGSVVYNEVNNNTTAKIINNSNIKINGAGNLTVNAVNSVMGYNGLGLFDLLIKKINYKIPGQEDWEYIPSVDGGKFGLGANIAWDNYTNNATAKIDNSTVNAENGNINVDSATEQSYMNVIMTGAKSKAFGIDGSIHVQNICGDTISQISNITGDKKITANNVSVNSGKAHIRTTAGNIERDEITKQANWKVQDDSAQGDAKYVRAAKDEITNIILQGAWTSQYEEVDNVVQANSQGVAVGAGVNVTTIDRTVKATIDNSKIDADNVTVSADTYNQKIDIEVAAAFSGGVTQANAQVQPVQDDAAAAQDPEDLDDDNIFGNLFDLDDDLVENPIGENALQGVQRQFSMSLAGAVDITLDNSTVESSINNSVLNVKDNLTSRANKEAQNINFGGGLGQSKKVGAGAAINYYKQDGYVKSYIDESTVTFSGDNPILNVLANNKNWILNIEIGAGVASNQDAQDLGFEAALGGSAIINTLKADIESYINNSTIKMAENTSGKIDTTINGKSEVDIINIAGGGTYMRGGSYGLSAGAAFGYNNIKNTISTYVKDSTLENIKGLKMSSEADNDIIGFAIAAAIIQGLDGTAFAFAGSVDVDYVHDTISSKIINSTITASDDVEVNANSGSGNLAVTGTFDFTSAEVGAGAAGDVAVSVYRNIIESGIDKDSKILKGKDIKVSALSTEKSNVVPVGASVATNAPYVVAAANVAVNVVNNTVKAVASGQIGTGENSDKVNSIIVSAFDETTIYTRGATLAYSGQDGQLNIAGTVNVDVILKEITALVSDADIDASNDVSVTSASINSLGGTKNSEGEYDRDDITSPTYVDKLLNKNEDGEYTGLKTDNPFYNWNMFYDISVGANANFAGVLIVKVVENELNAEVTNSTIKAKNLSVIANDYSVKNIVAGSVPAAGKIAIGGSVLYTLDKSNVYALITNGSDVETDLKTDVKAINTKDNIQVVAVAGGCEEADINISFSRTKNDDITVAKIDRLKTDENVTDADVWSDAKNVTIKSEDVKVNAVNDINATHVTVTGGGAENIAVTVNPSINTYNSTVKSGIANATITNAAIDIDAHNNKKSRDILIGLAGAGQGVSLVGVGLRNYYTDNVKAFIEKSVIDTETTAKNIDLASSGYVNNSNWIISGAGVGEGAAVLCNVLLNDLDSNVESSIIDSDIKKANDISLTANKDKTDDILNVTGSLSISGIGGAGEINVIQTTSSATASAFIKNTSIKESNSINAEAYNKKDINNTNIGIGGNFKGFTGAMDAIINNIESTTVAEIDTAGKEIATNNKLNVNAQETLYLRNKMGVVGVAIIGGSIVGNININNYNSLVNSAVKSTGGGSITAGDADIKTNTTFAMTNSDVAINTGIGSIPVTVVATDLGTKLNSIDNTTMTVAGINTALDSENSLQKQITGSDISLTGETTNQGGTIASVSGNLTTNNDINIQAKNVIKGYNGDTFKLTNVNPTLQVVEAVSPVVYTTDIKSLTKAEINSGIVKSTSGNINISSENKFKADYTIVKAGITGLTLFQGNFAYLTNQAETSSVVKDTTLEAVNININAKTDTQSDISQTFAGIQVADVVNFAKNENENKEKVSAIITGDSVNITTTNDLNIYTTTNNFISTTLFKAELRAVNIADLMRNYSILSNISQAIISAASGEINVGNDLNIATLSPNGVKAEAYLWDINAIDLASFANPIKSEANLSSVFASGIGNLTYNETTKTYSNSVVGVSVNTAGATNIYSGIKSFDDDSAINSLAFSRFYGMENLSAFNTTTYTDYAFNNMTNYAMLSSADHKANSVNIKSVSNKHAKTDPTETDPVTVANFGSTDVQTKVTGKNTINISGKNDIATDTYIELTDTSTAESDYAGVSVDVVGGSDSGFETSV